MYRTPDAEPRKHRDIKIISYNSRWNNIASSIQSFLCSYPLKIYRWMVLRSALSKTDPSSYEVAILKSQLYSLSLSIRKFTLPAAILSSPVILVDPQSTVDLTLSMSHFGFLFLRCRPKMPWMSQQSCPTLQKFLCRKVNPHSGPLIAFLYINSLFHSCAKHVCTSPQRHCCSSREIVQQLLFCLGPSTILITENGKPFISSSFQDVLHIFQVHLSLTETHHVVVNGCAKVHLVQTFLINSHD